MTARRATASVSAVLAVLVVLVVAAGTLLPMSTAGGQVVAGTAADAECTTLEVLLLMDESASLKTTDPQNRRVEAADVLVRSLAASAQAAGGSVNLTIAGFGSGTNEVGQAVLPPIPPPRSTSSSPSPPEPTSATPTTCWPSSTPPTTSRDAPPSPTACKRLVWFTDGAYSIDDTSAPGIATYTSSTQKAAIEGQFEGQICGDLPPESRLTAPVSAQIRAAGFVVQLVDLRAAGGETATERQERAATDPVIARLLTGDGSDPCRVPGERVEAGQATALADEFFTQGQIALGRRPVECADLSAGFPSPLVQAASARGNPGTTITIRRDGTDVASGDGFASYTAPANAPTPGTVTVASSGGPVTGCYADLAATVAAAGTATVIQGAPSGLVGVAVRGGAEPGDCRRHARTRRSVGHGDRRRRPRRRRMAGRNAQLAGGAPGAHRGTTERRRDHLHPGLGRAGHSRDTRRPRRRPSAAERGVGRAHDPGGLRHLPRTPRHHPQRRHRAAGCA